MIHAALLTFYCSILAVYNQLLDVISLPEIFFSNGSLIIAPSSIVLFFCEFNVSDEEITSMSWYKDNALLVHDVPHIRLRKRSTGLLLFIDNFQTPDNGVYHCMVELGSTILRGEQVNLTGNPLNQ